MKLNRVYPLLLEWARRYDHLRDVTAADVTAAAGPLSGSLRRQTLTALRSLFGHRKKPAGSSPTPHAASAAASAH
jgi:hypothetical protein